MGNNVPQVAVLISIGIDGKIIKVADAQGVALEPISASAHGKHIDLAKKIKSHSMNIRHLVVNHCYVTINTGRRIFLIQVLCP